MAHPNQEVIDAFREGIAVEFTTEDEVIWYPFTHHAAKDVMVSMVTANNQFSFRIKPLVVEFPNQLPVAMPVTKTEHGTGYVVLEAEGTTNVIVFDSEFADHIALRDNCRLFRTVEAATGFQTALNKFIKGK